MDVVVDEPRAEGIAEKPIVFQRQHRFAKRLRQRRGLRLIRRVGGGTGIERPIDTVQSRQDLGGHVEIGIGGGLSDPIFQPGRGIVSAAEHAHHHAPVVASPDRTVRRQRIRAIALIAVDGRRREHGRCASMLQQPSQILTPERAQEFTAILAHERVLAARARHDRLMQMPTGCEHVRQPRPAHEGRVIAVAMADLLHGAAKHDHGVGRLEPDRRFESEFALARAELDLDRSQRQAERQHVAPDDLQHRLHLVVALLG